MTNFRLLFPQVFLWIKYERSDKSQYFRYYQIYTQEIKYTKIGLKFFCRILKPILFTMQMHFQCKIQKPKIKAQKYCLHSCNMLRSSQRWSKSRKCDVYVVCCDFINAMCGYFNSELRMWGMLTVISVYNIIYIHLGIGIFEDQSIARSLFLRSKIRSRSLCQKVI